MLIPLFNFVGALDVVIGLQIGFMGFIGLVFPF